MFIELKSNLKLACDDLETFTGERKTHKRRSDAIRSPEFVTKVAPLDVMETSCHLNSFPMASGWPLTTTSRSWKLCSSPGWLEWPARGRRSFNKTLRQHIWPVRPRPGCTSNYPHWPPDLWSPSSSDLNPLDYYVWAVLEKKVCYRLYNTKQELKNAIVGAMDHMDRMEVKKACSTFRHRLEAVIEKKGGHIE